MLIGRVWICRLLFVYLFVNLSLYAVTDFSTGDKASGVKFCTMVHGRPRSWAWNLPFWGTSLPQKPKIRRIGARRQVLPIDASPLLTARSPSVDGIGVYRQYLPSACVDIRPSPRSRAYLFVCNFVCLYGYGFLRRGPRIKLAASSFARRFIGILGRDTPILGNVALPEAQNSL